MWNRNIDAAPRGKTVTITETDKDGKLKDREEFRHESVWLWTSCGKKMQSRWLPPSRFTPKGRWEGLATTEQPVAWHPFFTPADPVSASVADVDVHFMTALDSVGGI